jgi:thiol:disulfide interchange protein DsbD
MNCGLLNATAKSIAHVWLVVLLGGVAPAAQQDDLFGSEMGPILTTLTYVSHDTVRAGDTLWLAVRLNLAPSWHVNSAHPREDYLIPTRLEFSAPTGFRGAGTIVYPSGHDVLLIGDTMSVYKSGATILVPVTSNPLVSAGPVSITGTLHYQGCDDNSCVAPNQASLTWRTNVGAATSALKHSEIFAAMVRPSHVSAAATAAVVPDFSSVQEKSELERLIDEHGFWGYILAFGLAFGTGFLLSFSPCTYPMIPITVSIFAGQARGPGRGFFLSLVYVLTMAVIYGIMGVIVATVGGVFGAWLAHPVVVAIIVAIFFIFALSMFGLFELQVPGGVRNKLAGKGGGESIGGVIVLGAIAALVISPCVGPFVAGIMLYVATTGSALMGFAVLFTFALGLGTLFVLIGTFSSSIQALPRAGTWMESVKKFFGFVLLLMALYFLRTLISTELLALLTGLLFLGAGVFGGGFDRLTAESPFFPRLKKALGVLCAIIGIYLLLGYFVSSGLIWPPLRFAGGSAGMTTEHLEKIPWQTDLNASLSAARADNKPVLIDTWATWCANCKKLDQLTWSDDAVAAEAARFAPVKLQLETNDSPQTREFLKLFALQQYSLPTIILMDSGGRVRDIIFGFVDPQEMLARMRAVS